MIDSSNVKKERKNPNDPARLTGKIATTTDGETAQTHIFLDEEKIQNESLYDGLYAVSTDLLDDEVEDILKVSEGRWEIEECFISLVIYRYLEKSLDDTYTCDTILSTLKSINFASVQEQGFIPLYRRNKLTDKLHEVSHFRTDYEFITKKDMKTIQKKVKAENKLQYFKTKQKHLVALVNAGIAGCFILLNCQRWNLS